jgi:topoisomerase-4 subunit B
MLDRVGNVEFYPNEPFMGKMVSDHEAVEWGIVWTAESLPENITERRV